MEKSTLFKGFAIFNFALCVLLFLLHQTGKLDAFFSKYSTTTTLSSSKSITITPTFSSSKSMPVLNPAKSLGAIKEGLFLEMLGTTALAFLFLCVVFIPMEKAFPAKANQAVFRPHWFLDFCYFLGQYLLWNGLVLYFLYRFNASIAGVIPENFTAAIKSQHVVLQALEVLFFSDFIIYWAHRLQHNVDFLWRFHKVHHTAEHLDWLAAHREHPLDSIYTVGLINLPAFVMGFDLKAIGLIVAFRGIWAIYIHSNVRLPIGFLKMIIGSPELHHWHHDIERDAGNYANISPLMDILFGTYVCPTEEPKAFGIKEDFPKNYIGQMLYPLLPKRLLLKMKNDLKIQISPTPPPTNQK